MWNWIDIEEMAVRDPAISGEGTRSRAAEYHVTVHSSFYPMFIMLKRSSNLRMWQEQSWWNSFMQIDNNFRINHNLDEGRYPVDFSKNLKNRKQLRVSEEFILEPFVRWR